MSKFLLGLIAPIDLYRSLPIGGATNYILNFLSMFQDDVVLFDATIEKNELFIERKIYLDGKKFSSYPIIYFNNKFPIRLFTFFSLIKNRKWIKYNFPEVSKLYIHSPEAVLPFTYSKQWKIIYHMHGATHPLIFSRFKFARTKIFISFFEWFINKPVIKRSDLIVVINKECEDLVKNIIPTKKTFFLPNLVNPKFFFPIDKASARKNIGIDSSEYVILYVGRLAEVKGLLFFIEVLNQLIIKKNIHNIRFYLVGEGELEIELKIKIDSLGISQYVQFVGRKKIDELNDYYNSADLVVLPSYKEGTPMALLEAMACGVPIVCSNAGDADKLLKNYNCRKIIEGHDLNHWVNSIVEFINNMNKTRCKPFLFNQELNFIRKFC